MSNERIGVQRSRYGGKEEGIFVFQHRVWYVDLSLQYYGEIINNTDQRSEIYVELND